METLTALWRRLDSPGHDACRFQRLEPGWQLDGLAVFRHGSESAALHYRLLCDSGWRTRNGSVQGFIGNASVELEIQRTPDGVWTVNGKPVAGLQSCLHLDFGFTPATNFPHVHQLALEPGQAADLPVAWLDVPPSRLQLLPQRYERRSESTYWYEAPTVGYADLLEFSPAGISSRYPGLWELER